MVEASDLSFVYEQRNSNTVLLLKIIYRVDTYVKHL